jgi:hypothetical protein
LSAIEAISSSLAGQNARRYQFALAAGPLISVGQDDRRFDTQSE